MRRRRELTGWLLMIGLFVGAMALIFYILLMRAQHLARMEEGRTDPEARVEQLVTRQDLTVMHASSGDSVQVPHYLVIPGQAA